MDSWILFVYPYFFWWDSYFCNYLYLVKTLQIGFKNVQNVFDSLSVPEKSFKTRLMAFLFLVNPYKLVYYYNPCLLNDSAHTYRCTQSISSLLFTWWLNYFTGHSSSVRWLCPFQGVYIVAVYSIKGPTCFVFFFFLCWSEGKINDALGTNPWSDQ